MLIDEVRTEDRFDALRPEWNALMERIDAPSPFQTWEWCRTWWRHFGGPHALRILAFRSAGTLVGIAQLHERWYGPRVLAPTLLAPLGWEDRRRRQGITEQNEFVFPNGHRGRLLAALSEWLDQRRWLAAMLPGILPGESLPDGLARRVVLVGQPYALFGRPLPVTWEEFVSGLGKSMRDNVKYYPKLLERRGHHFHLQVHESAAAMPAALSAFFDLHRARADAGATVRHRDKFASEDRRAFLREVAPLLADQGRLKVGLLEVDGSVEAAQIWLEMHKTMFVYYTGWNPDWYRYSVQLVATLECLKHAIGRGISRVEFLRARAAGSERNERWGASKQVRVNLTLARRPALTGLILRVPRVRHTFRLGAADGGGGALHTTATG